jgi:hypothetical protein
MRRSSGRRCWPPCARQKAQDTPRHRDLPFYSAIYHSQGPSGDVAENVAADKLNKANLRRVRFTIGSDWIGYNSSDANTNNADLTVVECLCSSVVSSVYVRCMALNIKDFYLNTPMDTYKYMRIPVVKEIPDIIIAQY